MTVHTDKPELTWIFYLLDFILIKGLLYIRVTVIIIYLFKNNFLNNLCMEKYENLLMSVSKSLIWSVLLKSGTL